MALWTGLGQAATVAQLVGVDVGGLVSMIMQATLTARQNRKECEQLARRVLMIAQLLPHVQDPETAQQLAGLGDTLRDAHELVVSCQGRSAVYQLVMAGRQAERFREVQSKIDFYLILFPVISHIGITRRLERIYNVLVQGDSTGAEPSQVPQSSTQLQEVAQELVTHETQEFTFLEIMAATNNFSLDNQIGEGGFGIVYRGRLHDGREVAVKRMGNMRSSNDQDEFRTEPSSELAILSRLRHKHIVHLLGSCVTISKDTGLQATMLKKKKGLLTRRRKEPQQSEQPEMLIVYEYMPNGTLFDHLHSYHGSSELSSVILSWKMRVNVLLGVSRAMEHLHCHANPPIIHRDIKSSNIVFDANWVPHVSDFGYGRLSPASDVYNLGMVMLEVLTGIRAHLMEGTFEFGAFSIVPEFLDRRPVPEPTPWQLQALKRVAWTARCCLKLDAKDRLAISDVVDNLEMAHELICRDEPVSVDEPGWFEELPESPPHASSVPFACYQSFKRMESEVFEEGR